MPTTRPMAEGAARRYAGAMTPGRALPSGEAGKPSRQPAATFISTSRWAAPTSRSQFFST